MVNQYLPTPPEDDIRPHAQFYYRLGLNDKTICDHLKDHYDQGLYGLSVVSFRRLRKKWNLLRTRQQKHTYESICNNVRVIRQRFPFRGANTIRKNLRELYGQHVSRRLISDFLRVVEPEAVKARKGQRFKRKQYWAAGVNDAWPQDQHDKWQRFGLFFHQSCDAYSGSFNWVKVWWTNSNPRLIASYYLEACRRFGGVPLITQSDPGPENYGVANAHTVIRQRLDNSLRNTRQHRFMRKHQNIKSEIQWSIFRRDWAPGFEDILDEGVLKGWYDPENVLENLVFRWLAIPWIQAEIDDWMLHRNQSQPRADKHKILPHGIPDIIRAKPERYGSYDFMVRVPSSLFDEVQNDYAPPDHPVFLLVPPELDARAEFLYRKLGCPPVDSGTFWDVYQKLLGSFHLEDEESILTPILTTHRKNSKAMELEEEMELIGNLAELRNGANIVGPRHSQYIGGMVDGPPVDGLQNVGPLVRESDGEQSDAENSRGEADSNAMGEPLYVEFTSSEEDSDDGDDVDL